MKAYVAGNAKKCQRHHFQQVITWLHEHNIEIMGDCFTHLLDHFDPSAADDLLATVI